MRMSSLPSPRLWQICIRSRYPLNWSSAFRTGIRLTQSLSDRGRAFSCWNLWYGIIFTIQEGSFLGQIFLSEKSSSMLGIAMDQVANILLHYLLIPTLKLFLSFVIRISTSFIWLGIFCGLFFMVIYYAPRLIGRFLSAAVRLIPNKKEGAFLLNFESVNRNIRYIFR